MTVNRTLLALLLSAIPLYGGNKIKIQIVESTNLAQTASSSVVMSCHLKAILPDGSHAYLLCKGGENKCYGIVPNLPPEKINPDNETCSISDDKLSVTCTTKDLGVFDAERTKDELIVYSRNGKHKYRIVSSW